MASAPKICRPGGSGLFLPISDDENNFEHDWLRGVLYAFGMMFFFLGIAIIADVFMGSIEAITSKRVQRKEDDGRVYTEKLWNETVATLSLMALGSSAPEIFLAVIELFKKDMHTGELGPSVIVGSAAFNFFVIIAVCIAVIPADEMRRIDKMPAFVTTAIFSALAYLWLVFILIVNTADIVDIWEGVATFTFLPLLIWVSYSVDVGAIGKLLGLHTAAKESQIYPEDVAGTGSTMETNDPTLISFASEAMHVKASFVEQTLEVGIERKGSLMGTVSCAYCTEGLTAVPGLDYEDAEGRLELPDGVKQSTLNLKILPKSTRRSECKFLVILDDVEGEARFNHETDGGEDLEILTVSLKAHENPSFAQNIATLMNFRKADWLGQFSSACYCNGGKDAQTQASALDWAYHAASLPWKLVFAFIPPSSFMDGWPCFCFCLLGIGLLTAVVSDLAELFGCVLGLADIVTAITFVALGTSMPDLFASRTAAIDEPCADASVVNVTGSNSVNVFLGLGLPWTIASIYWPIRGRTADWTERYPAVAARINGAAFVVESRDLGFSVIVYCVCWLIGTILLVIRSKVSGAVLGGPFWPKVSTSVTYIVLWCSFVGLTSWRALREHDATESEEFAVICTIGVLTALTSAWAMMLILTHKGE
mmetsp:Transcript_72413/g.200812  ORF Transcript_72413/g.200812 Transcript_72413/m.200812 type:complete len:651 (+) Transcript_72413:99-2051(+)